MIDNHFDNHSIRHFQYLFTRKTHFQLKEILYFEIAQVSTKGKKWKITALKNRRTVRLWCKDYVAVTCLPKNDLCISDVFANSACKKWTLELLKTEHAVYTVYILENQSRQIFVIPYTTENFKW